MVPEVLRGYLSLILPKLSLNQWRSKKFGLGVEAWYFLPKKALFKLDFYK
jgi:hypothetical protein